MVMTLRLGKIQKCILTHQRKLVMFGLILEWRAVYGPVIRNWSWWSGTHYSYHFIRALSYAKYPNLQISVTLWSFFDITHIKNCCILDNTKYTCGQSFSQYHPLHPPAYQSHNCLWISDASSGIFSICYWLSLCKRFESWIENVLVILLRFIRYPISGNWGPSNNHIYEFSNWCSRLCY